MERAAEDESATADDRPPDDSNDESDFVEVDPTGRYGRYEEVLGKGAYKTVYKAFDEVDGIEVAWNQVKVRDMLHDSEDVERLYSELHLLKTLKHKNIIKFYNSWVDIENNNVNFITEIFTSGTLRQYRKKHRHVDLKAVKNWSRQILRGLLYLHSHDPPIIHRDLKCDNIFINGNQGEVKIGDLGLAAILQQAHAAHSVLGTPEFMAPELYEEEYNELVDIYSFGMCLLEMITFEYPYSECTNAAQIYKKVTMGKRPAALDKVKDPQVCEFLEKCLASVSQRLHARELLNDPFLRIEGECDTVETFPHQPITLKICGNMKEPQSIPEDTLACSALRNNEREAVSAFQIESSGADGKLSSFPALARPLLTGDHWGSDTMALEKNCRTSYSPTLKEEGSRRIRDIRIKGKMQDDKKILVRIRITNLRGEVRYIQFDFDLDDDTAMSVASEMVTELDLSDQDAITIAETIDAEILALVPEWKPGVAPNQLIKDDKFSATNAIASLRDSTVIKRHTNGFLPHEADIRGINSRTGFDEKILTSQKIEHLEELSGDRNEGFMYGRFEDVGYRHTGFENRQQESDAFGFFSDSSDQLEGIDESELSLDSSVCGSYMRPVIDNQLASHPVEGFRVEIPSDVECSGYQMNCMDSRKFDTNNSLHQMKTRVCLEFKARQESPTVPYKAESEGIYNQQIPSVMSQVKNEESAMLCHEPEVQGFCKQTIPLAMSEVMSEEDVEAEELKLLTIQQEQEIQLLRCKHEQAILDLKTRLHSRDGLPIRSKVFSGKPTQPNPGLLGFSFSTDRLPCQSCKDTDSHHRPFEVNMNVGPGTRGLKAAICDDSMSNINTIDLKEGTLGASPPIPGRMPNGGTLVLQQEYFSPEESMSGTLDSSAMEEFDSSTREESSWIGGSIETNAITVSPSSRQFSNISSLGLAEKPKAPMVSHPISKMKSQEAVVVSGSNQCLTSLNELQEATIAISQKEHLMQCFRSDSKWEQMEALDCQNSRGTLDCQSYCIELEKATLVLRKIDVAGNDSLKIPKSTLAKRESYLELYKDGGIQKDKLSSSKLSEIAATAEIPAEGRSPSINDLKKLKKVQLQKSIAELEAKTLEGLCQPKTKYSGSNLVKNHSNSTVRGN